MEYVGGATLDRLLATSGPFTPDSAAAITQQILDALQYSHENGVIH
jgi:eukaryotic-like serine/threonine-protein kinase